MGPLRGVGCACRRGPRTSREDSWAQGPGTRADVLLPGSALPVPRAESPGVSRFWPSSQCLLRPLLCFLLPAPQMHMFPGSPSSIPLSLQPVSPVPPPQDRRGCPRLSAPSHISPRDGTGLHPSPHSARRSHTPGAGVTLQVDALPRKASTPRLSLLVDTRLSPLSPPRACLHMRALQDWAGMEGWQGRARVPGPPWDRRSCSKGHPTRRGRTRAWALATWAMVRLGAEAAGGRGSLRGSGGGAGPAAPEGAAEMTAARGCVQVAAVGARSRPHSAQRWLRNLHTEPMVVSE